MTVALAPHGRNRRATEAGLLALAGLIIGVAFALVSLGRTKALPALLDDTRRGLAEAWQTPA